MTQARRRPPAGSRPGTLVIPPGSPQPEIYVFNYGPDVCDESRVEEPAELRPFLEAEGTTWVDVRGFGDEEKLLEIARIFGVHRLALAAATNVPQRAGFSLQAGQLVGVARLPDPLEDGSLETPQVAMIADEGFLLTFQDRYFGFFEPVRERIRAGNRPIRSGGPGYLMYALLSTLVDRYFPVAEELSQRVEDLEDQIVSDPRPAVLNELHQLRRELVTIRRIGQPQLDALRSLHAIADDLFDRELFVYFHHVEQQLAQGLGIVESARDLAQTLGELYLSVVSERTNEIMKVLTLVGAVFIPLTFIAGIYGMNFENMPELRQPFGYPLAVGAMLSVAAGMAWWFRRKGWIGRRD